MATTSYKQLAKENKAPIAYVTVSPNQRYYRATSTDKRKKSSLPM